MPASLNDDDLANFTRNYVGDMSAQPVTTQQDDKLVRLYDDRAEPPKRSLKDMAAYGLIPLVAGLAGGLLNGNDGAMAGLSAGVNSVKDKVDTEDQNYQKVTAAKELNRSHLITAKLLREFGDGAGGGLNKNRYQNVSGLDKQSGKPVMLVFDRQEGKYLDGGGKAVPYSAAIYENFVPDAPSSDDAALAQPPIPAPSPRRATGGSSGSSGAFVPPRAAPPKADASTFNATPGGGAAPALPTKLPGAVKQPGGTAATTPASAATTGAPAAPVDPSKKPFSQMSQDEVQNEVARLAAEGEKKYQDLIDQAEADAKDMGTRAGESLDTAKERRRLAAEAAKEARGQLGKIEESNRQLAAHVYEKTSDTAAQKTLEEWRIGAKSEQDAALEAIRQKGRLQLKQTAPAPKAAVPADTSYDARLGALKGSDRQHYDQAVMGLRAADDMDKALSGGSNTFSLIGDNPFTISLRNWNEAIGRLQSGGAINKDEEGRFRKMAPGPTDSAAAQRQKINEMKGEMSARINSFGIDPQESLRRRRAIDAAASTTTATGAGPGAWMVSPPDPKTGKVERMFVKPEFIEDYKKKGAKVEGAK